MGARKISSRRESVDGKNIFNCTFEEPVIVELLYMWKYTVHFLQIFARFLFINKHEKTVS